VCTRQDLGREYSIRPFVSHMLKFTKSVTVSVAVSKMGVVFRQGWCESQWTLLLGYVTVSTNARCYEIRRG